MKKTKVMLKTQNSKRVTSNSQAATGKQNMLVLSINFLLNIKIANNRNSKFQAYKWPLEINAKGTSTFMSAVPSPKGNQKNFQVCLPQGYRRYLALASINGH